MEFNLCTSADQHAVGYITGHSTESSAHFYTDREGGRKRREEEAMVVTTISKWYRDAFIDQGRALDQADIITVHLQNGAGLCAVETVSPSEEGLLWKPRASAILWDPSYPYYHLVRAMAYAVRESSCSSTEVLERALGWGADSPGCRERSQDNLRASQALERAFTSIYYAEALCARGELHVPDVRGITDTGDDSADMASIQSKSRGAKLLAEKIQIRRCFDLLRTQPYLHPLCYDAVGRQRMVDTYIKTRCAYPRRCSQIWQWPLRIACIVFVVFPHLVPVAPSGSFARALTLGAHRQLDDTHRRRLQTLRGHHNSGGAVLSKGGAGASSGDVSESSEGSGGAIRHAPTGADGVSESSKDSGGS